MHTWYSQQTLNACVWVYGAGRRSACCLAPWRNAPIATKYAYCSTETWNKFNTEIIADKYKTWLGKDQGSRVWNVGLWSLGI